MTLARCGDHGWTWQTKFLDGLGKSNLFTCNAVPQSALAPQVLCCETAMDVAATLPYPAQAGSTWVLPQGLYLLQPHSTAARVWRAPWSGGAAGTTAPTLQQQVQGDGVVVGRLRPRFEMMRASMKLSSAPFMRHLKPTLQLN